MKFSERLYSNKVASDWNGAYPLGNGIMGAMADGGVTRGTFYLNDGGFWAGTKEPNYRANDVFLDIKKRVMSGDVAWAEQMLWKEVYGEYAESYLPLCALHIDRNIQNSDTYTRVLDITKGIFNMRDKDISEEAFLSHTSKVMCIRDKVTPSVVTTISVSSFVHNSVEYSVDARGGSMLVCEIAPSHMDPVGHPQAEPVIYDDDNKGIMASVYFKVLTDGKVTSSDSLVIRDATYIEIITSSSLNSRDEDTNATAIDTVNKAISLGYDAIKAEHVLDFGALYNRNSISLGEELDESITTVLGLQKYSKHPSMAMLIFNYGRYLMISASREDSNCMNLQGIWNADFKPPWSSAYTVNINIEMNYWIAESTNLSECHMPLFRQLKVLEKSGRRTAREQLHTAGWVCGHNSDIWGHSNLTGRISNFNPSMYAMYISGGAWLATHIYTHYAYTHDEKFLREYYYIIRGVAEFYMDYAMDDNETSYKVLCPGSSPENAYNYNGRHYISKNATMDSSIARNIFNIIAKVGEIVGEDEEFLASCKRTCDALMPLKVGKKGGIVEWYDDYKETEKTHRHLSHLYGLYPDNQISLSATPDLASGALRTIKRRGNHGIGWSLAWKTCMLARLHEGEKAFKVVCQKLKYYNPKHAGVNYGGCYDNLFCAPPMQIDGNFGITAAIREMLLSTDGENILLPALPKAWNNGSFKGFKLEGGYTVSATWAGGSVTSVRVDGVGDSIDMLIDGKRMPIAIGKDITF